MVNHDQNRTQRTVRGILKIFLRHTGATAHSLNNTDLNFSNKNQYKNDISVNKVPQTRISQAYSPVLFIALVKRLIVAIKTLSSHLSRGVFKPMYDVPFYFLANFHT